MNEINYDLAIIGSGPGGYVAAIRAAQLNLKVVVVEKKDLGGVCLNWGCIPTKALLRTSEIYDYFKKSPIYGLNTENIKFTTKDIINRSRKIAKKLSNGIEFLFKKNKINVIYGVARIRKDKDLEILQNDKTIKIKAKNIIIATGASPIEFKPSSGNIKTKLWSYLEAMTPIDIPKSLGIIGSGAIGIEFACFYNALGAKVKVYEMQKKILPNEDGEVSELLKKTLSNRGIEFELATKVLDISEKKLFELTSEEIHTSKKETNNFEKVLVATGVKGNTSNLGLENTKIKIKNDQIVTYLNGSTDESNIYAIGDVAGTPWLAHKASHEGIKCVEHITGSIKDKDNNIHIPSCVYSNPQVASIGLTENKAKKLGINIKVGKFPLSANGKALSLDEPEGFVKTIFEANTGQILGAHLIGAEVTELINTFALAIRLEATELDIFSTIFPHPTISETIHESSLDAFGKAIHI